MRCPSLNPKSTTEDRCERPAGHSGDHSGRAHSGGLVIYPSRWVDEPTYRIVRFHQHGAEVVLKTGVSLAEARAHCERDDTRGDGWFDGYRREGG